jgi:hypothetical protein
MATQSPRSGNVSPATGDQHSFAEFVERHPEMHPELPLVHSTLVEYFRLVAQAGKLQPRDCPVFGEPLIYLFYGRPAYRSTRGAMPDTTIQCCPVCFIFKPTFLKVHPARIYPFDTGAAKGGRFEPLITPADTDDFKMHPALKSVQRFTHAFFETNGDYFLGRPREGLTIPADEEAARKYYSFVSHEGPEHYDDRRSAVEFQYDKPISLRGMLWAVALPTSFLQQEGIRRTIVSEWGAFPLTYSFVRGSLPNEYATAIRTNYERWLREGSFL